MIYRVVRTVLKQKKDPGLYEYLDHHMHLSNNLYNATLFRIRQNFTSRKKEHPTENALQGFHPRRQKNVRKQRSMIFVAGWLL